MPDKFVSTIWIPGPPVPKGRPRVVTTKGGAKYAYSPRRTAEAEAEMAKHFMMALRGWRAEPGQALAVKMTFRFGKDAGTLVEIYEVDEGYTRRPDADNLEKLVLDVLGRFVADDAQVVHIEAQKEGP